MFSLFKKNPTEHLVLFDVNNSSVAGAYVAITPDKAPVFFYTKRVPIPEGTAEDQEERLLSSFTTLSDALITEGAPRHRRATKTGHIDSRILSVGYPWQKTTIHTKTFDRPEPFIFTREMRDYALQEIVAPEGMELTARLLLATLLNGYHVGNAVGKTIKRADMLMVSTGIETNILETLRKAFRSHFHTDALRTITSAPVAYFVTQDLYPHEEEVLIVNISRGTTDIAIVKKHLLVDVMNVPIGTEIAAGRADTATEKIVENKITFDGETSEAETRWIDAVAKAFSECAGREALPRTIFLLAEGNTYSLFKNLLDSKTIRSLWLSDTKLAILPIEDKQLSTFVKMEGDTTQDIYLSLIALFYSKHKEVVP